jgi:glycerol-3-phosphate dehydrogenase
MTNNKNNIYDICVVGGGINGVGIACDAAGRGLSVLLCEANDLASATSSASSKLIHGGLRYLEHYEFRLVREALAEREVLLSKASHIVRPLKFVLPHVAGMRPRWMLRLGLFLYDHLYRRKMIPGCRSLNFRHDSSGAPLLDHLTDGFCYWDCWVDDARLVVLNARAAADNGAEILVHTKLVDGQTEDDLWRLRIRDQKSGAEREVRARAVVNAAGPWATDVARRLENGQKNTIGNADSLRLVKGSHIVVPRIPGAEDAYILQNDDGRVIFVMPYETNFSLIGTTDTSFEGDPSSAKIDDDEVDYLLRTVRQFFKQPLAAQDVVWSYSGVRPLYDSHQDNPAQVTRDYRLQLNGGKETPPLLSVLGGKVTIYRYLAEEAMEKLKPSFPGLSDPWTATVKLPGGDLGGVDFDQYVNNLCARYPEIDAGYLRNLARRHGDLCAQVLGDAKNFNDLGQDFGCGLYEREVLYMKAHEWATTPDDILWRRSKVGLHMSPEERLRAADGLAAIL